MKKIESHVALARKLTRMLDTRYSVFGIKFGIDPILNVIPGFGGLIGAALSCYLFWIAYRLKAPHHVHLRMAGNIVLDYLLGLIPFAGIVADLFYRSNIKNFALVEKLHDPDVIEGEYV